MSNKLVRFDWAMKYLLRDKANFDILEGFLSALFEDDEIKILNILESESNSESETDKFNRVDLLIQDSKKRKIFIEIQNTRETDYLERLLYSSSKIVVENQNLGDNFKDISKVISISILYFNLGIGNDYIYHGTTDFTGINTGDKLIVKKRIDISKTFEPKYKFIEKNIFPEYYFITVERYKNVVKKRIDEWIYMIKNNEIAEGSNSKNIDKAKQKLSELNMSKTQKKTYEKYLINLIRDKDIIETARTEGEKAGLKKGELKGLKKVAKQMKTENEPIEKIIKFTGLTKNEIENL